MTRYDGPWRKNPDPPTPIPDLSRLHGVVAEPILRAAAIASKELSRRGIPHMLVGGLAIGAYGYIRATNDVDFVVGKEAFKEHDSGIVSVVPGVPIRVDDVPIDPILPSKGEEYLQDAISHAHTSLGVPVAPLVPLIAMKLASPRKKDSLDVVELLRIGHDAARIRGGLESMGVHQALIEKFDRLIDESQE